MRCGLSPQPSRKVCGSPPAKKLITAITQAGGTVREVPGPFGWELTAQVLTRREGVLGTSHVRYIGVNGPRWFLRGMITRSGKVDPAAVTVLEGIFRDTVVYRGRNAMAPFDPIALARPLDFPLTPATSQS
ncbi:DUF3710 domain-containing protein [Streptomyces xanthophaeus]